jgi:hypothetical protein
MKTYVFDIMFPYLSVCFISFLERNLTTPDHTRPLPPVDEVMDSNELQGWAERASFGGLLVRKLEMGHRSRETTITYHNYHPTSIYQPDMIQSIQSNYRTHFG